MSTPPGEGEESAKQPGQDPWSWEPRTSSESSPPPPEPLAVEAPAIEAAPAPSQPPPPGLAWDAPAPSPDAGTEPAAPPSADWVSALPDSLAQPTPPPPTVAPGYPARFDVAYPPALSRWKTLLRLFLAIPAWFAASLVMGLLALGLLTGYMTVFWRKKYPDWLFRGNAGAMGFIARTYAYSGLLTDKFPSFSPEESPVTLEFDPPPSGQLSRWRVVFWKSLLLWPMQIVLQFLGLAMVVVTMLAWFAILFAGNYPRGLFQFSVGVQRWYWRATSYQASFNDRYPPYALSASAGPGSNSSVVINGVIGGVLASIYGTIMIVSIATAGQHETADVNYAQLLAGRGQETTTFAVGLDDETVTVRLTRAVDPGDSLIQIIRPARGERIVVFQWVVVNGSNASQLIAGDVARLEYRYDDDGDQKTKSEGAVFTGINDVSAPARVREGSTASVQAVFVIPDDAEPTALWFRHGFAEGGVKYEFD